MLRLNIFIRDTYELFIGFKINKISMYYLRYYPPFVGVLELSSLHGSVCVWTFPLRNTLLTYSFSNDNLVDYWIHLWTHYLLDIL